MPIKTDFFDFDREKVADSATIHDQISGATPSSCANTQFKSGGPRLAWRRDTGPRGARAIFPFVLGDRRMRLDQAIPPLNRPPAAVLTDCDRAVVRVEFCQGHDQLACTEDLKSEAPRGQGPTKQMEQDAQACEPVALLAEFSQACPEFSKPALEAMEVPDAPGTARSSAGPSPSDPPGDTTGPMTLLDPRMPQRGWEQEYGVPSYLIGAADVLYFHRKRVANPDVAVIDAAILRLYWPWIWRGAASSSVAQEADG